MNFSILFTGQGAQYVGMGKDLYENSIKFRGVFDTACEVTKLDLKKLCFEGPLEELSKTKILQPSIVAISYGIYMLLKDAGKNPVSTAGFSLGEMSAMASLGILGYEETLKLVGVRGEVMEAACTAAKGAMYSIIGTNDVVIEEVCANTDGYVIPVNYNCPGQVVISGEEEAARSASETLAAKGARVVKLNVSGAFHSKLMGHGSEKLKDFASGLKYTPSKIKFFSNLTGGEFDFAQIKNEDLSTCMSDYIIKQMSNPVRFRTELEKMEADGTETFVEIGVGKVLSGFVKRTNKTAKFINIEDTKSFAAAIESL